MIAPHLFCSMLSEDIQDYLDFKRALGRKFKNEEAGLRLFDHFLSNHNVNDRTALTPALIETFLLSRPRTRPRSFNHLLGVLRCFFIWTVTQGRLTNSPVLIQPRQTGSRTIPFLFEPKQVERILVTAAQLPDNSRAINRGAVYSLIFRLMYGLGLRVGEIARLSYGDVDQTRGLLVIRETKFGKSRLVPFGPNLRGRIQDYLASRVNWYGQWEPDDPLFSFSKDHKRPLRTETIIQTFHKLLPKVGFVRKEGVASPRLHCLRHSFAVQTLLRWYRSGIDPGRKLFHLSTFMGHSDPVSTSWYLTITDELLQEAASRFENLVDAISQEVSR